MIYSVHSVHVHVIAVSLSKPTLIMTMTPVRGITAIYVSFTLHLSHPGSQDSCMP